MLKIGTRISVCIDEPKSFTRWLYEGINHTTGTIEKYNEHTEKYLIKHDNPPPSWCGVRPWTHTWLSRENFAL